MVDHFNAFAPVKDIRMVRNRATKRNKDFAFIEFHTQDEAEGVLRTLGTETFIHGQPVMLSFSKAKRKGVGTIAFDDFHVNMSNIGIFEYKRLNRMSLAKKTTQSTAKMAQSLGQMAQKNSRASLARSQASIKEQFLFQPKLRASENRKLSSKKLRKREYKEKNRPSSSTRSSKLAKRTGSSRRIPKKWQCPRLVSLDLKSPSQF